MEGDFCILEVLFDVYRINITQREALTLKGTTSGLLQDWKYSFSFISFIEPLFHSGRLPLLSLSIAGLTFELCPDRWQNLHGLTLFIIFKDLLFSIYVCVLLSVVCIHRITLCLS